MYKDNIISEVWENRASYAEQFHHNIKEMIKDLNLRQKSSNRSVVDRRISPNNRVKTEF